MVPHLERLIMMKMIIGRNEDFIEDIRVLLFGYYFTLQLRSAEDGETPYVAIRVGKCAVWNYYREFVLYDGTADSQ